MDQRLGLVAVDAEAAETSQLETWTMAPRDGASFALLIVAFTVNALTVLGNVETFVVWSRRLLGWLWRCISWTSAPSMVDSASQTDPMVVEPQPQRFTEAQLCKQVIRDFSALRMPLDVGKTGGRVHVRPRCGNATMTEMQLCGTCCGV